MREKARVCAMCGAREGQPHHDPEFRALVVELAWSAKRERFECQVCADGMAQLEGDEARDCLCGNPLDPKRINRCNICGGVVVR